MRNIFFILSILVSTACGTQIGNPGMGRRDMAPWFKNEKLLFAVNSQMFHNSVDAMTVSDYAYSTLPSRVMSSRSCEAGTLGNVKEEVTAKHSVVDATSTWLSNTELELKRSYRDAWTLGDQSLACDQGLTLVQQNALELFSKNLRLESELRDNSARQLRMEARDGSFSIVSRIDVERNGRRQVEFRAEALDQTQVRIHGEVKGDLRSVVSSADEFGRPVIAVLKDDPESVLRFVADRDSSGKIVRRSIEDATLNVTLSDLGTAQLKFEGVTWTSETGCLPQSGRYSIALTDSETQATTKYEIDFAAPNELQMTGEGEKLFLDPFACVLREG